METGLVEQLQVDMVANGGSGPEQEFGALAAALQRERGGRHIQAVFGDAASTGPEFFGRDGGKTAEMFQRLQKTLDRDALRRIRDGQRQIPSTADFLRP